MKREEIEHLAELSRIKLDEKEIQVFSEEIAAILEYVGVIKDLTVKGQMEPTLTPRFNVFRPDVVTNDPDHYSADLLEAMPNKKGRHMVVKKILSHD